MELELKTALEEHQREALEAIKGIKADLDKKYEEAKAAGAPLAEIKSEMERMLQRVNHCEQELSRPLGTGGPYGGEKSIGQLVVENDETENLRKKVNPGGGYSRGTTATIPLESFFLGGPGGEEKNITSAAVGNSTPGILTSERLPGIVRPAVRRVRVRDLMTRMTTKQNSVEWVKENVFTNAASPVAETISKPQSALTFTIDHILIKTLAHWIRASKQILDDFAMLQQYIDLRLIEGLKDVEDYELVGGDGTGQHLSGLNTEATAYDTARNVASDTKIDKLNHAISQIEDINEYPDGIIVHPRDWRAMQLVKTEEGGANKGMYLLGGPAGNATPTLWGLPVATTTAVAPGNFYVGAFKKYCIIFDRMDARVDISTEDQDNFIKNLVTVRAEERIGFAVTKSNVVLFGSY